MSFIPEEAKKMSERSEQMMRTFARCYVTSFLKQSISANAEAALSQVLAELKEDVMVAMKKKEKKEEAEDNKENGPNENIVAAKICSHKKACDIDTAEYTAYSMAAVKFLPEGAILRAYDTRYRQLFHLQDDLKTELSDVYPESAVFPPKKWLGSDDPKFVEERSKALDAWLKAMVKDEKVALSKPFMTGLRLEEDPQKLLERAIFTEAFYETCDKENLYDASVDPSTFEDEGQCIASLLIEVANREAIPAIEAKIDSNAPKALRGTVRNTARKSVYKAVGRSAHAGWERSRRKFVDAKKVVHAGLAAKQEDVNKMLKNVLNKIVPPLLAALSKKAELKKQEEEAKKEANGTAKVEEKKEEEKPELAPTLKHIPAGGALLKRLQDAPTVGETLKPLQVELKDQLALQKSVSKSLDKVGKHIADRDLLHLLRVAQAMVNGVYMTWLNVLTTLLEGVSPLFKAQDELEAVCAAAEKAGKDVSEGDLLAAMTKAQKDVMEAAKAWALNVASSLNKLQTALAKELRAANASPWAVSLLKDQALETIAVRVVEFVAGFRRSLLFDNAAGTEEVAVEGGVVATKLAHYFSKGRDAKTVKAHLRARFVAVGTALFDTVMKDVYLAVMDNLTDAAIETLAKELRGPAEAIVNKLDGELSGLIPDEVQKLGFDLDTVKDIAIDKTVDAIAGQAVRFIRKQVETRLWSEEEK